LGPQEVRVIARGTEFVEDELAQVELERVVVVQGVTQRRR
jgi:hypothetical protein